VDFHAEGGLGRFRREGDGLEFEVRIDGEGRRMERRVAGGIFEFARLREEVGVGGADLVGGVQLEETEYREMMEGERWTIWGTKAGELERRRRER